jgi:hypothetical protein
MPNDKTIDEHIREVREAGGSAWDNVADVGRELRIIRGEPIEFLEAAVEKFLARHYVMLGIGNHEAAAVALEAAEEFKKLLD